MRAGRFFGRETKFDAVTKHNVNARYVVAGDCRVAALLLNSRLVSTREAAAVLKLDTRTLGTDERAVVGRDVHDAKDRGFVRLRTAMRTYAAHPDASWEHRSLVSSSEARALLRGHTRQPPIAVRRSARCGGGRVTT